MAEVSANVYASKIHAADIAIPAKYGIPQIVGDTGGPAGMMMGLRAVPVYLQFCREMEKRCPDVVLFNHSNPMAVLMRAMHKYTSINVTGDRNLALQALLLDEMSIWPAKAEAMLDELLEARRDLLPAFFG